MLAVVSGGKLAYAKGFGVADIANKIPVTPDTRFAVGSITKQFTAASVLLLAQRGKLSLDDRLSKYYPTFPNAGEITLRMLLNQTSGLHNYPELSEHDWPTEGPIPVQRVIDILATDKPDFTPGSQWEYSNANYTLLSGVVGKAAGSGEAAFLQKNIFGPLAMTSSGFGYAEARRVSLATPYQGHAPFQRQQPISLDLAAGAGGSFSTASDVAKWDLALMQGTLLDAASMRALWSPGRLTDGQSTPYSMGFVPATLSGHRELWHNGLTPGAGGYCYNAIFPDDGLAVIVLSNGYNFNGTAELMVERVLAAYYPGAGAMAQPTPVPGEDSAATAQFARRLTPQFLAQVKAGLAEMGTPTDWIFVGSQSIAGATVYRYWIRIDGVPHIWSVAITPAGKIAGSKLD